MYEFDAGDVYSATAAGGVPTGWSASFAPVQKLPTVGASDFESFSVDYSSYDARRARSTSLTAHFLLVANQ